MYPSQKALCLLLADDLLNGNAELFLGRLSDTLTKFAQCRATELTSGRCCRLLAERFNEPYTLSCSRVVFFAAGPG